MNLTEEIVNIMATLEQEVNEDNIFEMGNIWKICDRFIESCRYRLEEKIRKGFKITDTGEFSIIRCVTKKNDELAMRIIELAESSPEFSIKKIDWY